MSWLDRLKPAAYTTPSGARIQFEFEDVSQSSTKKTAAFEFASADGTYVQDNGVGSRRFPIRAFFSGADYDQVAQQFMAGLEESGVGVLEHPVYGAFDVVPFGDLNQRDDLVTAANQAAFEVTFYQTIGQIYPSSQIDPAAAVQVAVEDQKAAAGTAFAENSKPDSVEESELLKNQYSGLLDSVKSGLDSVAKTLESVDRQFNDVYDSLNLGIDVLVGEPLTLAFQTSILIESPARASAAMSDKLAAYGALLTQVTGVSLTSDNDLATADLYGSAYVSASCVSAINSDFTTRREAIEAAAALTELFDFLIAWRDQKYSDFSVLDTGEAYYSLQNAVAIAAGYLVQLSFSLKTEETITLDRDWSMIELCYELYGTVDSVLDFFITSNNLTNQEIISIPRGRQIVYFV